jgi:hypothetical protein
MLSKKKMTKKIKSHKKKMRRISHKITKEKKMTKVKRANKKIK